MVITRQMLARQIAKRAFDPYNPEHDSLALARKINAEEGWSFEKSAPLNGVLVVSEVHISDEELVAAHAYAEEHYAELI